MDKFIRNCLYLMLLVFTLFIVEIQVKRLLNSSQYDNNPGDVVSTNYAKKIGNSKVFDMDVLMDRCEIESVRKCEDTVMKPLTEVVNSFRRYKTITTDHHTYMATGKRFLIEVGGKFGEWSERFQELYKPRRHIILEPNQYTYKFLKNKFKTNERVTVLNFGLAAERGHYSVRYTKKGPIPTESKRVKKGWTNITLVDSTEFFKKLGVGPLGVDLLSFDCQGCEYEVMETMFLSNMTNLFKNIQIKWYHNKDYIKDKIHRYCSNVAMLSRSHQPTYLYPLEQVNWRWKGLP